MFGIYVLTIFNFFGEVNKSFSSLCVGVQNSDIVDIVSV